MKLILICAAITTKLRILWCIKCFCTKRYFITEVITDILKQSSALKALSLEVTQYYIISLTSDFLEHNKKIFFTFTQPILNFVFSFSPIFEEQQTVNQHIQPQFQCPILWFSELRTVTGRYFGRSIVWFFVYERSEQNI